MTGRLWGAWWLAAIGATLCSSATHDLEGRVVSAQTGDPVARARVLLRSYQQGQAVEVSLLSDADGTFHVANVPEGGYQISCTKAGYLPAYEGINVASTGDAKPAPVVVRLTSQVVIEGTLVDDQGAPVAQANVQVVRQAVVNGRRQFQWAAGDNTDETGAFRVFGMPAGRYFVCVVANVTGVRRAKHLAYPVWFYPNATDVAGAQGFDLQAGQDQPIQMRLPPPLPAREIRGQVVNPGRYANLQLTPSFSTNAFNISPAYATSFDAKTGTFKISGVTAGVYNLEASTQAENQRLRASTVVTVGSTDVTGIRLEPVDVVLSGNVRVEGDAPPAPQLRMGASPGPARLATFISIQSSHATAGIPVDNDGNFHLHGPLPDTYRVIVQSPNNVCAKSILQGSRDALHAGAVIPSDGQPEPLDVLLTSHCGTIEGTVMLPDSDSPTAFTVALLRQVGEELVMERQLGVSIAPRGSRMNGEVGGGALGTPFSIQGVAPGDYFLYAWAVAAQIEYADAAYMRQFESARQAVTVTADSKVTVTIDRVLGN
ncbi:MAG TPA: carboxypeptidase-like regulatory domain-containing protein [Bryobacteraceae bacterium]|nr:carboxypeptidase-like regulatory domain-containing protein [Bryobacteraceae bacterium]